METARELPSGKWQGRYTGPDGKRYTAGTHTSKRKAEKAAALALASFEERMREAEKANRPGTNFAKYAESYLWTRRPGEPNGLAPGTYYKYQRRLMRLNKTFGAMDIEEVTSVLVREWWNAYTGAPTARADTYQLLCTVMNLAIDDEIIDRSPCRVKGAHKSMTKPRPTFVEEDIARLYSAAHDAQGRALIAVLAGTAMRIGEAVALDWSAVSFWDSQAEVVQHYTALGMRDGTKGGEYETRSLALPEWVIADLAELLKQSDGEGPIFRNKRGTRMSVDSAERWFRVVRAEAKLERMHLHDFRHFSLTQYARQPGVTLKDIMARGGHRNEKIAMRYQHTDTARDQAMVATLPNPMLRSPS